MVNDASKIEVIKYIVSRIIERANEAKAESSRDPKNDFEAGRKIAYYEVLDILQSELDVHEFDLNELGLDINLLEKFL